MRIVLTIVLLFFISIGYSQKIQPKIAVDYFPKEYNLKFQNPLRDISFTVYHGDFRTRLGGEFIYKKASVYFDQHIYMKYSDKSFDPTEAYWYVGAKYSTKYIKIQFEHLCIHPINTYSSQYRTKYYGGYNTISISYGY